MYGICRNSYLAHMEPLHQGLRQSFSPSVTGGDSGHFVLIRY